MSAKREPGSGHRDDLRAQIGQEIRSLREEKEISLREFARMMDLSPGYISQVERGVAPPPTLERLEEMSRLLGANLGLLADLSGRRGEYLDIKLRESDAFQSDRKGGRMLRLTECDDGFLIEASDGGPLPDFREKMPSAPVQRAKDRLLNAVNGLDADQIETLASMAESYARSAGKESGKRQ